MHHSLLPPLLVAQQRISQSEADKLDDLANRNPRHIARVLVEQRLIGAKQLQRLLARHFGLATIELDSKQTAITEATPELLKLCEKWLCLPVAIEQHQLTLAVADPTLSELEQEFRFAFQCSVVLTIARVDHLIEQLALLKSGYKSERSSAQAEPPKKQTPPTASTSNTTPIDRFIAQLLELAQRRNASDIHIEPYADDDVLIRFRCDGLLQNAPSPPTEQAKPLITRLKIMAQLDISQQRLPQDGRLIWQNQNEQKTEYRVSTLPLLNGEKMVLRLTNANRVLTFEQLGLTSTQQQLLRRNLAQPQGMVLITGPTGSGKSQTLYSALSHLNQPQRNIITAEDPIEQQLDGINQLQLHTAIGLNYAQALRAFLRQDPDVIMLGEIRDNETAHTAIKAAQTGHLMLSTLHTNSALETVVRLINMGVEGYQLSASLNLVIAQRLVRRLCSHCKQPQQTLTKEQHSALLKISSEPGDHQCYQANSDGCLHCHQGYIGRVGVFELLPISTLLRETLESPNSITQLSQVNKQLDYDTLFDSAIKLVVGGITSWEEINRVIPC